MALVFNFISNIPHYVLDDVKKKKTEALLVPLLQIQRNLNQGFSINYIKKSHVIT